jgi:hypothetical protein
VKAAGVLTAHEIAVALRSVRPLAVLVDAEQRHVWYVTVMALSEALDAANKGFDIRRFIDTCGVPR